MRLGAGPHVHRSDVLMFPPPFPASLVAPSQPPVPTPVAGVTWKPPPATLPGTSAP